MMNASTPRACGSPCDVSATATGSAPPMYVPIVGTNCETTPVNTASGRAYGVWRISRKTNVNTLDSAASTMRELMKSDTLTWVISQRRSTSSCRFGVSQRHTAARNRGPAARR